MTIIKNILFIFLWDGIGKNSLTAASGTVPAAIPDLAFWLMNSIWGCILIAFLLYAGVLYKQKQKLSRQNAKLLKTENENQQLISVLAKEKEEAEQHAARTIRETESSLKEARRQQLETENRLHEAEQLHNTFFTYTVHEMRTPLSLVSGTLRMLTQKNEFPPETFTQLVSAYRNSLALQDLADQLIDTRHITTTSKHLRIARYDLVDITRQICDLFIDWIALNKIDFRLSFSSPALWVWFDRRKMEYALRMLLSNSFQNTYLYGKIAVSIEVSRMDGKSYCVISVQDDGLNENESTRRGLKQIAGMIQDLSGKFEHPDTGGKKGSTRYSMYIPLGKLHLLEKEVEFVEPESDLIKLNEKQKEEISEMIQITSEKKQTGKKLLIIDDSDQIRWFLKHVFSNDYQLLEARNGNEGLEIAGKETPDLILCDVMMPGKNGFETCKELKNNLKTCQIPVIMLTAKVESEDVIAGIENGADDYITKPFDAEVLRTKIKNLLKRREELKQYFTQSLLSANLFNSSPSDDTGGNDENAFMASVIKVIGKHINNPKFEAKVLADELYMSLPTLYRKIKQHSNYSILELTRTVRLKKAAELISTQQHSIQEIAEMVGFNDIATFRKRFTEQFGVTPSGYGQGKRGLAPTLPSD